MFAKWLPTVRWKKYTLIFLLVAAVFSRFYNLPNTVSFLGDQGRDAMIVADIFRRLDPVFIGPVTSVGNLYLGPLYYYFMLPFLWLTYPSPLGPVYAVALLGIITVYLVYFLGKKMLGENAALVATFFYTFSAVITQATRFSWNPNPAPLVSLLLIYTTWIAWKKNPRWWVWAALCLSVLFQLHYLTLLALPAVGLIWLVSLREHFKAHALKSIIVPTLLGVGVFLLSIVPLILFDIKHEGTNLKAFQALMSSSENFAGSQQLLGRLTTILKETEGRGMHILFEYMIGKNRVLNQALLYATLIGYASLLRCRHLKKKDASALWVIGSFLITGILGTAVYQHTIFDHYIAYLFPVTAFVYGALLTAIKPKWTAWGVGGLFVVYFLSHNLPNMPLRSLGWTITDVERTSQEIAKRVAPNERYNLVLLSETGDIDGQSYRYFLSTTHTRPVDAEERGSIETLFIIDEEKKLPKVVDSPIYEIVVFPNKTPAEVFTIEGDGPQITVLRRTTQSPDNRLE